MEPTSHNDSGKSSATGDPSQASAGAEEEWSELLLRLVGLFPGMAYQALPEPGRPLTFASGQADSITGVPASELMGPPPCSITPFVCPEHRDEVTSTVERALSSGSSFSLRYPLVRRDGETVWVWDRGTVRPYANGPARVEGWLTDITQLVHTEQRAVTAQRREALGELIGAVAGEYSNLLTSVLAGIDLSRSRLGSDPEGLEALEDARSAARRGGELAHELLTFALRRPGRPVATDLNEVVRRLEPLLHQLLPHRMQVVTALSPDLPQTRIDPGQLEQVVLNLALNARDAMEGKGRIILRTREVVFGEGHRRADDDAPTGPYLCLEVRDSGPGIQPGVRTRMFEPFVTTKEGRAGLGLATAFGIVRQARGMIRVQSEPGEGTTFTVLLPSVEALDGTAEIRGEDEAEGGERKAAYTGEGAEDETPLVLVVDDEDAVRRSMVRILERSDYRTLEASDSHSALAAVEEAASKPDLLLTDVMMPGPKGTSLADRLQERIPGLPVVFVSGHVASNQSHALRLGPGREFLSKPFTMNELLSTIRAALRVAQERPGGPPGGRSSEERSASGEQGTG